MAKSDPIRVVAGTEAEQPRLASMDERRIINQKLQDVYGERAYTAGWSDERVAKDLGVPRAWVAQIRELAYGPDVDENQGKVNAAIDAAFKTASVAVQRGEEQLRLIRDEVDRARKLLADAEALLRHKR